MLGTCIIITLIMKKYYRYAMGILVATALTACGSNSESNSESAEDETADVTEVVDVTEVAEEPIMDDTIPVEEKQEVVASNNWDSTLDSYEKLVDKYISLAKKAQAGDMSALADYASIAEESQKLSNKLNDASGMTPAQMARYQKITAKMASAAM